VSDVNRPDVTLVEFLLARLDEREAAALAASPGPWKPNAEGDEVLAVDDILVADGFALSNRQLRATVTHIVLNDPARVLAEVAAKRRIIVAHQPYEDITHYSGGKPVRAMLCPTCVYIGDDETSSGDRYRTLEHDEAPCDTLRLLALPYADMPGYRDEWRP
jgi:hypothetical protein